MSAIIVTRGDVDLNPILDSIPTEWETIVWDNGEHLCGVGNYDREDARFYAGVPDLSVYGRYAAIQYASHDLIWVQDDDCIVSDPEKIVETWTWSKNVASDRLLYVEHIDEIAAGQHVVANMPPEFRPHYQDSCLVGFGACFHRDLPARAFQRYVDFYPVPVGLVAPKSWQDKIDEEAELLHRTCDVVFTTLTPRVLVDVPVEVLPYAHGANRMWKQPDHYGERTRVLEMARKVRNA